LYVYAHLFIYLFIYKDYSSTYKRRYSQVDKVRMHCAVPTIEAALSDSVSFGTGFGNMMHNRQKREQTTGVLKVMTRSGAHNNVYVCLCCK
jgi:hypothetical protein